MGNDISLSCDDMGWCSCVEMRDKNRRFCVDCKTSLPKGHHNDYCGHCMFMVTDDDGFYTFTLT